QISLFTERRDVKGRKPFRSLLFRLWWFHRPYSVHLISKPGSGDFFDHTQARAFNKNKVSLVGGTLGWIIAHPIGSNVQDAFVHTSGSRASEFVRSLEDVDCQQTAA